jgi:hypothetical protein
VLALSGELTFCLHAGALKSVATALTATASVNRRELLIMVIFLGMNLSSDALKGVPADACATET